MFPWSRDSPAAHGRFGRDHAGAGISLHPAEVCPGFGWDRLNFHRKLTQTGHMGYSGYLNHMTYRWGSWLEWGSLLWSSLGIGQ